MCPNPNYNIVMELPPVTTLSKAIWQVKRLTKTYVKKQMPTVGCQHSQTEPWNCYCSWGCEMCSYHRQCQMCGRILK